MCMCLCVCVHFGMLFQVSVCNCVNLFIIVLCVSELMKSDTNNIRCKTLK